MNEATTNGNGKHRRIYNLEHQVEGMSDNESVGVVVEAIRDMAKDRMNADVMIHELKATVTRLEAQVVSLASQNDALRADMIAAQEERDVAHKRVDDLNEEVRTITVERYSALYKFNTLRGALDRLRERWGNLAQARKLNETVCALDLVEVISIQTGRLSHDGGNQ